MQAERAKITRIITSVEAFPDNEDIFDYQGDRPNIPTHYHGDITVITGEGESIKIDMLDIRAVI